MYVLYIFNPPWEFYKIVGVFTLYVLFSIQLILYIYLFFLLLPLLATLSIDCMILVSVGFRNMQKKNFMRDLIQSIPRLNRASKSALLKFLHLRHRQSCNHIKSIVAKIFRLIFPQCPKVPPYLSSRDPTHLSFESKINSLTYWCACQHLEIPRTHCKMKFLK